MEAEATETSIRDNLRQDHTNAVGRPVVPETLVRPYHSDQPNLICLMGVPGSGKSYLARELTRVMSCGVISSDTIRYLMFSPPKHTNPENEAVFNEAHRLVMFELLRNRDIVFDATNLREKNRCLLQAHGNQAGANTFWFWLQVPREVAEERIREREGERAPELLRAMRRMEETADWPSSGFIALNGEMEVSWLAEMVRVIVDDHD